MLLDWIFPRRCLACRSLKPETIFCAPCRQAFPEIALPNPDVTALGRYEGILLSLIARMKYQREERVAEVFGDWLGEKISQMEKPDLVLPVPVHSRRLRERGFNQAAVIARSLGKRSGLDYEPFLLKKIRETVSQVSLSRDERLKNLDDCFLVSKPERIKNKSILLVDDVYTTGTTMNRCAAVLKKAGAKRVHFGVVAVTPIYG